MTNFMAILALPEATEAATGLHRTLLASSTATIGLLRALLALPETYFQDLAKKVLAKKTFLCLHRKEDLYYPKREVVRTSLGQIE